MSITIELPPDLEEQIRRNASAAGIAAEAFIVNVVAERLQSSQPLTSGVLSPEESRLLQAINQGLPEATWQRYRQLVKQCQTGSLNEEEHSELKSLTDTIEVAHIERLKRLVELSRLRQVSVEQLMEDLGIHDLGYD